MLVRIRSKDGTFRFELQPSDDVSVLAAKILETTQDGDPASITVSSQPRGGETNISILKGRTLANLGLKHGDLVFVSYSSLSTLPPTTSSTNVTTNGTSDGARQTTSTTAPAKRTWELVQEDEVDGYWRSRDGKITRGKDSRFCKHGPNAMCDYCMPLEPYDPQYHTSHAIKHLSYHAYLRKLSPSSSKTSASAPPLSPLSYTVKTPCPNGNHPPWPAGICTACQPPAITLQPQIFRMVDHVEFASEGIVDSFIQAWRQTGLQRFGWLIGRYEPYEEVPMGIKAVVEAIHEPPQEGELDGLSVSLPWDDEARITAFSKPLMIVGQIFTDLTPEVDDKSKSQYKRHPQSFFLSSLEAILAAHLQRTHPTPSKSSPTGVFASRFVTAVISGTQDGSIDIAAYQASEQACAMVEADMIEASVEPGTVRVKEEDRTIGSARYVPEVFFRYRNEYGLEVKKSARPCFPVEYLIVNVTHGFPKSPSPLFRSAKPFPIENRFGIEEQDISQVLSSLARLKAPEVMDSRHSPKQEQRSDIARWLSDWHLIAFLGTVGIFSDDDMKILLRTAISPNLEDPKVLDDLVNTTGWQTLMTIVQESAPAPRSTSAPSGGPSGGSSRADEAIPQEVLDAIQNESSASGGSYGATKTCPHCTFENPAGRSDCEVCGLPLNQ